MSQLSHTPLQPPRPGTPGEAIYLQLWQDYIATRQDDWRWIFNDLSSEIDQRTATVAASFMTWMGCNAGMDFTHQAIRIWKTGVFHSREQAFLAAWATRNRRLSAINSGLRCAEYMLASTTPILHGVVRWDLVPTLTQSDIDVIECMVVFWSSRIGESFRDIAEPAIESANRKLCSSYFRASKETV